jgi:hypothetical protein
MKRLTRLSGTAFVLCAAVTSACLNLDDAAALTKTADAANQTLPVVVRDWPASCERINALTQDIPANERPAEMQPQDCAPYKSVSDHIVKDEAVLIAYFDALGKLASNTLFTFDKKVDTNVAAIGKLPGLAKQVEAATTAAEKLGKALADLATRDYRSRKVDSLIQEADDSIRELTTDLKDLVAKEYAIQLANEANVLDTFYQSPIRAATGGVRPAPEHSSSERLSLILVQRQYSGEKGALVSRRTAAENYGKVMDSFASLHAKLKADIVRKATLREIAGGAAPYVSSATDAINAIREAIK